MNVALKICGMKYPANVLEVGETMPSYMGFIFYKMSPRYVGENFLIPDSLDPRIKRVGVFVNEDMQEVSKLMQKHKLNFVQLHGNESVEYCAGLRSTGVGVIKVFSVDEKFDFKESEPYEPVADYFLFDTKGRYYGGNAQQFNWKKLQGYNQSVPFFLSGGIEPVHIAGLIDLYGMNLHAIDVNSGVESSPGMKQVDRIKELMVELKQIAP